MSNLPSNTPKRQKMLERLEQRMEGFRKHHDNCEARQAKAFPARKREHLRDSVLCRKKLELAKKLKMKGATLPEKMDKMSLKPQENECKSTASTVGNIQSSQAKKGMLTQLSDEAGWKNNENLLATVERNYSCFEIPGDVYHNVTLLDDSMQHLAIASDITSHAKINECTADFTRKDFTDLPTIDVGQTTSRVLQQFNPLIWIHRLPQVVKPA
ncbi:uncharacterized protein LOC124457396 isoform X2 [Xenia sp. Carnegie-2017]|uniref:uncharacterized protein LOC124457396 isoform X2 n=1 Tax=Xenia sp. Carnegie-2017 TaxID=2897299 RepID=UPI001F035F8F|nr:uncharacterized protein LOC124457396 isoform X2 [Xenia sp. Carnegie-2017]